MFKKHRNRILNILNSDIIKSVRKRINMYSVIKIKNRKITFQPIKVALLIIALVLIIEIIYGLCFTSGTKVVNIDFEAGNEYSAINNGSDVVVYNNKGIKDIRSNGTVDWEISQVLSEPVVETKDDFLLLYDLSGNHYAGLYKNGKMITELSIADDIISAKLSPKGDVVIATDTDGYKGKVVLFDKTGKELFAWNSGSGYVSDISVSDNGKYLGVMQLVCENDTTNVRIQVIDTNRGEVISSVDRNNEIGVELKFIGNNECIAVTDTHIIKYNKKCKELFNISLEGKTPSFYSLDSDDIIPVVTVDGRGNDVLEVYGYNGKLKGSYVSASGIRAIAVSGSAVALTEQRGIVRVSARGKEQNVTPIELDIKAFAFFDSSKRVIAVGNSHAEVLNLK